jgi:hypothetical protein
MMKPVPYPFVTANAVSAEFLAHVTKITLENAAQFKANQAGSNRKFMKMDSVTPEGDVFLWEVKQELAKRYDLGAYTVPPTLKDFIGYITEGGSIHPHTDPDLPGKRHVRINVLVKQPGGCIPLLENVPIAVSEGDAWLNLASQCVHATTPVEGPGYRSAISFGYQIEKKRGDELYAIHKKWMDSVKMDSVKVKAD